MRLTHDTHAFALPLHSLASCLGVRHVCTKCFFSSSNLVLFWKRLAGGPVFGMLYG